MVIQCSTTINRQQKILKCYTHESWTGRCPGGRVMHLSALSRQCIHLFSSGLQPSPADIPQWCVTLGRFHWKCMTLGDLISSDKLQGPPDACPNHLTSHLIVFRKTESPRVVWVGEEASFDGDLCPKLLSGAPTP